MSMIKIAYWDRFFWVNSVDLDQAPMLLNFFHAQLSWAKNANNFNIYEQEKCQAQLSWEWFVL